MRGAPCTTPRTSARRPARRRPAGRSARAGARRRRRRRARARRTCRGRRPPRRRPPAARPRRRDARRAHRRSACSAAITAPFMSSAPRPCRRPSSIAPDHGSGATARCPGRPRRHGRSGTAAGAVAGERRGHAPQRVRGASSPGWPGCGAQRLEVVLVQVDCEPGGLRRSATSSSAARSSPVTLGTCTSVGGVARERVDVERARARPPPSVHDPSRPGPWSRARPALAR